MFNFIVQAGAMGQAQPAALKKMYKIARDLVCQKKFPGCAFHFQTEKKTAVLAMILLYEA